MRRSAGLKLAAKFSVTALLFWIMSDWIDLRQLWSILAEARPGWAAFSLVLVGAMIASDALLYCTVMHVLGHHVPVRASLLYCLVGWFFSNITPSGLGADVFRALQMRRLGAAIGTALRSVVAMRLLSFGALVVVILAGMPLALDRIDMGGARTAVVLAGCAGSVALVGIYLIGALAPRYSVVERLPLAPKLLVVAYDFHHLVRAGPASAAGWTLALTQHLLRVGVLAALAASLSINVSTTTLFALTPVALLFAMIPISLGSWGLRETAFVFFLGAAGVVAEEALSLSIAFGLLRILVGMLGGIVWMVVGKEHYRIEIGAAEARARTNY